MKYNLKEIYQNYAFIQKPIYYVRDAQGNVIDTYPHFSGVDFSVNSNSCFYGVSKRTLQLNYCSAEEVSYLDYYPFGMLMPNRNGQSDDYRYGFGSHEKDDEVKGSGNHLSFGDMGYDPRIVRRWRPDPFENLYAPISPYAYALNSPIMFTDSDGNVVIGSDGKPVTYEKGEDGVVKWSENATSDIVEVGNAMLTTGFGEKAFNKWQNASTKITIVVDENSTLTALGETKPTVDANGKRKLNADGQYESAEIIFYKKKIDTDRADGSGKRFEGASYEETLGAVGTHEVYHNEEGQVKLDKKQPNEMQQKASKNLPINSEINFRKEYHKNNPGLPNEKTWKKNYEKHGYEGIKEEK